MKKKTMLCIIFLIVFVGIGSAEKITIAADPWIPFTGESMQKKGFMIDIAIEIFKKHGHTVEYKIVPWNRAIVDCRKGIYDAIAGANKDEVPDFVFSANSQGKSSSKLYVMKNNKFRYTGINSLKNVKLGAIKSYSYSKDIDAYISNPKNKQNLFLLSGTDPLDRLIKMLKVGRIDVIVEDQTVLAYTLQKLNMKGELKAAGGFETTSIYIAFSPANPKSKNYASILSNGIVQLRKSGELKKILNKYGVSDWK